MGRYDSYFYPSHHYTTGYGNVYYTYPQIGPPLPIVLPTYYWQYTPPGGPPPQEKTNDGGTCGGLITKDKPRGTCLDSNYECRGMLDNQYHCVLKQFAPSS